MRVLATLFLLHIATIHTVPSYCATRLKNADAMRKALSLVPFASNQRLQSMKIAIIDNGFQGYTSGDGTLPASATLVEKYDEMLVNKYKLGDPKLALPPAATDHGRKMAQIVWATTGASPEGPHFYLLNANGITNFRRAVRYAIEAGVDIVLYSQNRECCGNFDGRGFLNTIVNEATRSGILWINAAGNYGGLVYNGTVQGIENKTFRIRSRLDDNPGQIILNWTSEGEEEESGTLKDLDLFLADENGRDVATGVLKQVLRKSELGENETFLPRERIRYSFSANNSGNYTIRVRPQSKDWNTLDKIRITVIPEKAGTLEFLDRSTGQEIMVPADNPNVITVGDISPQSATGPTTDGRQKPEILLESSLADFSDGDYSQGTSNAAAYYAGVVAVMKSYKPDLTRERLISFPRRSLQTLLSTMQQSRTEDLIRWHPAIYEMVRAYSREEPLVVAHHQNGFFVIGIRQSPHELFSGVCGVPAGMFTEFYFALSTVPPTPHPVCFARQMSPTYDPRFPWQTYGGTSENFVLVERASNLYTSSSSEKTVWMTPNPNDLWH